MLRSCTRDNVSTHTWVGKVQRSLTKLIHWQWGGTNDPPLLRQNIEYALLDTDFSLSLSLSLSLRDKVDNPVSRMNWLYTIFSFCLIYAYMVHSRGKISAKISEFKGVLFIRVTINYEYIMESNWRTPLTRLGLMNFVFECIIFVWVYSVLWFCCSEIRHRHLCVMIQSGCIRLGAPQTNNTHTHAPPPPPTTTAAAATTNNTHTTTITNTHAHTTTTTTTTTNNNNSSSNNNKQNTRIYIHTHTHTHHHHTHTHHHHHQHARTHNHHYHHHHQQQQWAAATTNKTHTPHMHAHAHTHTTHTHPKTKQMPSD